MIIASPKTIAKLRQQRKLRPGIFLPQPIQANIPDTSLKDHLHLRKASTELSDAHHVLVQHGYQPARDYSEHDLSRSYIYPQVNILRIWQQTGPKGKCSIQFDSAKSTAASDGAKKNIPGDKLTEHLEQVDKYYGRKLEASGEGSGQYQHVATYRKTARDILQPELDKKKIQHQWQGKNLLVHPNDVELHGSKYGWTWKQQDLFSSIEAGGPPSDKGPGSGNYEHQKILVSTTAKLTEAEENALEEYQGFDYANINRVLSDRQENTPRISEQIKLLDSALNKGMLSKPTQLWRGLKSQKLATLKPGDIYTPKTFQSTTINPKFVEDDLYHHYGLILSLHAPTGLHAHAFPSIASNIMPRPGEAKPEDESEILLPRNVSYRINSVQNKNGRVFIDADVISSKLEASFDPGEARDEKGEWTKSGGLTPAPANRASWPKHLKSLRIPPAWTDVRISSDSRADLLVTGKDVKGRQQYLYSEKFKKGQAAAKFARIKALDKKFDQVQAKVEKHLHAKDPEQREHAQVTKLIMQTGIRPGSDADTQADKKAYGATTLLGQHVSQEDDGVHLKFIGKKGVALDIPVMDHGTAKAMVDRAKSAGDDGKLFPSVTNSSLLSYVRDVAGDRFKTKDLRTLIGTKTALKEMSTISKPTNQTGFKRAVKEVATRVAKILGNTPTVALQSYISPHVFSDWKQHANA